MQNEIFEHLLKSENHTVDKRLCYAKKLKNAYLVIDTDAR
jgi:hypothetical protein